MMSQYELSPASLQSLLPIASTIKACVKLLNGGNDDNGAITGDEARTARPESPPGSPIPSAGSLASTRSRLLEACEELHHLVSGPQENLMALAQSHRLEAALQYASHFRLATHVPVAPNSSITFADVAAKAGVPVERTTRVLRLLMTCFIFNEPIPGEVAHTPDSKLLLDDHIEAMVDYWTDESFRAAAHFSSASERWPDSQERNQTALNMAFKTTLPKFDFFDSEPRRAKRFRKAMEGMTRGDRFSLGHLVNGYEWASLPDGETIIDVGGGGGHCSMAIAAANPHLNFVVQDMKSAFEGTELSQKLKSRIQFVQHDFFEPQGFIGDVYLLRWILHDYPDKFALEILKAQVSAMRSGSKLIIMEGVMQPAGTQSRLEERKSR
jgi:6-hydroxytryprostatin B O-methyltransferase